MTQKEFTETIQCGYCRNSAPMDVVAKYSQVESDTVQMGQYEYPYDAGPLYQLIKCPACRKVSFREGFWHSETMDYAEWSHQYPSPGASISGLPDEIARAYQAAQSVKHIDSNAFGVLMGRLLEKICENRGAKDGNLDKKLAVLVKNNEIPKTLATAAKELRNLRDVGAHAVLGDLTVQEVPIIDNIAKALLDYVYSAPNLVSDARQRLKTLKAKRKHKE